jgi:O-antigen/teichoic acid export membrane protein
MFAYIKRLLTAGAAYQAADIASKGIAVFTLPLYTHYVSRNEYGAATSLLTAVILSSIFLRVGVGEAFVRFYFDDKDPERRARIARTATATVAWTTSVAAVVLAVFSPTLSRLILGYRDPRLLDCAIVGLWAFTNLEMAYAQLRVDERSRSYLIASSANVLMTVTFTVTLVVFAKQGARGLLLGNFAASAVVVLGLWWMLRARFSLRVRGADLRAMLRFGLPTVPADASVYALQVADRFYLFREDSHAASGLYGVAIQLATVVFVAVRGFQYAWPPLAYSIESDEEASRLYSLVTTYFVLATGVVVAAVALLARWMVRLLAAGPYYGAYRALPWLATGWALYGLYLVFVVIAGRARVTSRNFPAAACGLAANVVLLVTLVPASGAGMGIAGAGVALCGAYVVMLAVIYLLTRRLIRVAFEWRRLLQLVCILGGVAVSGELLLADHGFVGLLERVAWLVLIPLALVITRFFGPQERDRARALIVDGRVRVARWRARGGDVEAYADDPLRDV